MHMGEKTLQHRCARDHHVSAPFAPVPELSAPSSAAAAAASAAAAAVSEDASPALFTDDDPAVARLNSEEVDLSLWALFSLLTLPAAAAAAAAIIACPTVALALFTFFVPARRLLS